MKYIMCIDGGGTAIKYNVMDETGVFVHESRQVATPHTKAGFVHTIEELLAQCDKQISGISFSMPGFIDSTTGYIDRGGAIEYFDKTNFYQLFEHLNLPISIENDGRCFAIAEMEVGNAQGCKDFICFTIGTGVGTGIVTNGALVKGATFRGGEYGMGFIFIDGKPQMYHHACAMTALIQMYKVAKGLPLNTKIEGHDIFAEALTDETTADVLATWYRNLAVAIWNLVMTFNPEKILLGGGVSAQPDLAHNIEKEILKFDYKGFWGDGFGIPIEPAKYRNDSGFIGAFYHFKQMYPELFV